MPKFNLAKTESGHAIPATDKDKEKWNKVGVGEVVEGRSIDQRNYKLLAKYWVMVDMFLENVSYEFKKQLWEENQFVLNDEDDAHFYLRLRTGFVKRKYVGKDGNIGWEPKSISYDKCEEPEMQKYYNDAVSVVAKIIGMESDDLFAEIIAQFG